MPIPTRLSLRRLRRACLRFLGARTRRQACSHVRELSRDGGSLDTGAAAQGERRDGRDRDGKREDDGSHVAGPGWRRRSLEHHFARGAIIRHPRGRRGSEPEDRTDRGGAGISWSDPRRRSPRRFRGSNARWVRRPAPSRRDDWWAVRDSNPRPSPCKSDVWRTAGVNCRLLFAASACCRRRLR